MSSIHLRLLLFEDNPMDARLIIETLSEIRDASYVTTSVSRLNEGLELLKKDTFDAILLDLTLPDSHGIETVGKVQEFATTVPIIVLTGLEDGDIALQAIQYGAQDYLVKGQINSAMIARVIQYGIERKRLEMKQALLIRQLQDAITQIKTLRGMMPICSACKMIRDDSGYWHQVEEYMRAHTDADFTHSMCPECLKSMYAEYYTEEELKDRSIDGT